MCHLTSHDFSNHHAAENTIPEGPVLSVTEGASTAAASLGPSARRVKMRLRDHNLRREGGDEGAGLAAPGDGELVPGAGRGHIQQ